MTAQEKLEIQSKLAATFTPAAPVSDYDVFAGRIMQITEVLSAIYQKGQHAIIYGERGVGKTSLANVLTQVGYKDRPSLPAIKIIAPRTATFQSLWYDIFKKSGAPDQSEFAKEYEGLIEDDDDGKEITYE